MKDILPGDKLFSMSMSYFRVQLLRAKSFLSLDDLHIQAYSLRRGGATHYFRSSGSLDRTILRGRWLSAKSARIYIEDGVAQLSAIALSDEQFMLVSRCKKFSAYFSSVMGIPAAVSRPTGQPSEQEKSKVLDFGDASRGCMESFWLRVHFLRR